MLILNYAKLCQLSLIGLFVFLYILLLSTAMLISGGSVHLTTFYLGELEAVNLSVTSKACKQYNIPS